VTLFLAVNNDNVNVLARVIKATLAYSVPPRNTVRVPTASYLSPLPARRAIFSRTSPFSSCVTRGTQLFIFGLSPPAAIMTANNHSSLPSSPYTFYYVTRCTLLCLLQPPNNAERAVRAIPRSMRLPHRLALRNATRYAAFSTIFSPIYCLHKRAWTTRNNRAAILTPTALDSLLPDNTVHRLHLSTPRAIAVCLLPSARRAMITHRSNVLFATRRLPLRFQHRLHSFCVATSPPFCRALTLCALTTQ